MKLRNCHDAEKVAEKHVRSMYRGVKGVLIEKVWYETGAVRDVWLIEGFVELEIGERRPFKVQIDPESGELMGYCHLRLPR